MPLHLRSHLAEHVCLLLQADARWRQHAADDKLNRSLFTEVARHRIEEQAREKAEERSATLKEVTHNHVIVNVYIAGQASSHEPRQVSACDFS